MFKWKKMVYHGFPQFYVGRTTTTWQECGALRFFLNVSDLVFELKFEWIPNAMKKELRILSSSIKAKISHKSFNHLPLIYIQFKCILYACVCNWRNYWRLYRWKCLKVSGSVVWVIVLSISIEWCFFCILRER